MNIKTVLDLLNYVETEEKAYELIHYISNLEDQLQQKDKEIERLNNIINRAIEYIKAVGVKPKEIDSFVLLDILKGSDK